MSWRQSLISHFLIVVSVPAMSVRTASAQPTAGLEWRGFFTTGAVVSDSPYDYNPSINQTVNFHRLTRLGLNLSSKPRQDVEAAAQIVIKNERLNPDWAFAAWHPFDGLSLRAGKQKFPVWLMSDRLDVGKTYPWISPPEEVYVQNQMDAITGLGASYSFETGAVEWLAELVGGVFSKDFDLNDPVSGRKVDSSIRGRNVLAANVVVGTESVKLRGGGSQAEVTLENELFSIRKAKGSFWSYGINAQFGGFMLLSEHAAVSIVMDKAEKARANKEAADAVLKAGATGEEASKLLAQKAVLNATVHNNTLLGGRSFYVTGGYQAGDFLPHLTYARIFAPDDAIIFGDQHSVTSGVKYDVNLATDVKVEWQVVTPEDRSGGLFQEKGSEAEGYPGRTNIYKFALDCVF